MRPLIAIALLILLTTSSFAADVKEPDLAGTWYPASGAELRALLTGYLNGADPAPVPGRPFAIIVPHAGLRFSGPVAAYGYKAVRDPRIKTVILLGFSHRKQFDGISVYDRGAFRTPLGDIPVDTELAGRFLAAGNRMRFYPAAFEDENAIEMEIPFIQLAFPGAKLVPIAFGGMAYDDAAFFAAVLADVLKGRDDYLVVASTDLSHYHPYDEARSIDTHMIRVLESMKARDLFDETRLGVCELCGIMPVTATLLAAEKLGFDTVEILKYANSGDTFGRKENVVGYVSAVIYRDKGQGARDKGKEESGENEMFNEDQKKRLLQIARESMTTYVKAGKRQRFTETDPLLTKEMGAFVTLHENGQLRGCIGNMVGRGPLYQTVADMAIEAATGDPRFRPVTAGELDAIDVEVSVLTPPKRVAGAEEITIPGQGVIVRKGYASGVYLPQVATETGWTKEEFLTSLCGQKAGIDPQAWKDPATELYTFEAVVFGEKE